MNIKVQNMCQTCMLIIRRLEDKCVIVSFTLKEFIVLRTHYLRVYSFKNTLFVLCIFLMDTLMLNYQC